MLFNKLLRSKFFKSKIIAGVEVYYTADNKKIITAVILEKNKDEVKLVHTYEDLPIGEVEEKLKNIPVFLVMNGKGIIHKKAESVANKDDQSLLQKVLPNANIEQFYLQSANMNENGNVISVVRKNQVEELIREFKNVFIIHCSLGPFITENIAPFLGDDTVISTREYELIFKKNTLKDFVRNNEESIPASFVHLGDDKVKEAIIIPYSAALDYYTEHMDGIEFPAVSQLKNEFENKSFFKTSLVISLGVLFAILLVNYLFFYYYFDREKKLSSSLYANQNLITQLDSLKSEYNDKKDFLEKNGFLQSSRLSFYADNIAMDLPSTITFTRLNVFPANKKTENDSLFFSVNTLKVNGSCGNTIQLNNWIKILQKKKWVSNVAVLNMNENKESNRVSFELELKCLIN
jgi:Tfp pilus assembly protein PilN